MVSPTTIPKSCTDCKHLVFVPVPGREVFFFCLIVGLACCVWLYLLYVKGVRFEEDS